MQTDPVSQPLRVIFSQNIPDKILYKTKYNLLSIYMLVTPPKISVHIKTL